MPAAGLARGRFGGRFGGHLGGDGGDALVVAAGWALIFVVRAGVRGIHSFPPSSLSLSQYLSLSLSLSLSLFSSPPLTRPLLVEY